MRTILITVFCHPKQGSGVEKVSYEIGKKLSQTYKVIFLFKHPQHVTETEGNMTFIGEKTLRTYLLDTIVSSYQIRRFIKQHHIDLIIDNIGLDIGDTKVKKMIITHGTQINFFKKTKFKNVIDKLMYWGYFGCINGLMVKRALKQADKIITFSESIRDELEYEYKVGQKVEIIPNGCDILTTQLPTHKDSSKIKVLFISNDHIRKGIDILEKVADYFINDDTLEFMIMGREYKSKKKNVIYLGKQPRETVYATMQESSIIFLPSYYEGQPLTILEAMSFGCIPMLSHNCHCDFLQNTALDTFISKDNDADFYINQIKTLKQLDQKDLNTLRQESMKIVQSLSWDIISDAYLKVVTNMLLSAHQPPRSKD